MWKVQGLIEWRASFFCLLSVVSGLLDGSERFLILGSLWFFVFVWGLVEVLSDSGISATVVIPHVVEEA